MFYIIFSVIIIISIGMAIVVNNAERARQIALVKDGKAIFLVKISKTGRVYHSISCGKCKTRFQLSEAEAIGRG